ncbi:HNH endonuclease [Sedimentibacter hydroxybenzoicus DSM 7310]|uniref:HNH endonuclease n=1 Tax=Sedimentibacter hydroxybenzoicus DSM 7310 TaxID=1123245 RepID=A0A974BLS2_SEDHY|nr:HNH endonuclease domain-containing protein [Sedimentibacter hydroxybenzoicus]NYB74945.1 HNH endonuclease [Sedimentibacter hydroxybenzoicus DSM 7310]
MDRKIHLEIIYENNLDTDKFARMLDNKSQSYKFYWLEAILRLIIEMEGDLSFDQIINEMICDAWHTVTHYHLRLGPTVNGKSENFLEHAINVLNEHARDELSQNPSREELLLAINKNDDKLKNDKYRLTDYVPYKLLYPFLDDEGLTYLRKDQRGRLIAYMEQLTDEENLFYRIIDGSGLWKKVRVNNNWRKLIFDNYSVITSWIKYNKVQFLQDRNPGVPGIIYKISPESDNVRRLEKARDLWKTAVQITGQPIRDIYTGEKLNVERFDLDHFVPRSYIANDELWNLTPMSKNLNSSKNNKLPPWDKYFKGFAEYQFYLYQLIFAIEDTHGNTAFQNKFEKCRRYNLNSIWASESLYIKGNTEEQFINILEHNLKPVYDAAKLQGYDLWRL